MPTPDTRPVPSQPERSTSRMDHRFGRRYSCGTRVTISAGEGIAASGRMLNVSLSGAFVQTALDLPLFSVVAIKKNCEGANGVELHAMVVRKDTGGVGVEWCESLDCSICRTFGCAQPCHPDSPD
jgi:PilZ domain-containing protein